MPGLIEDYVQSLMNAAAQSPIVSASSIVLDKRTPRSGLIRGDLFFTNGTRLHFRELIEVQETIVRLMYSFHFQDADHRMIFRYDDTPHHGAVETFPHHKHIGEENYIEPSSSPELDQVLGEIERTYSRL